MRAWSYANLTAAPATCNPELAEKSGRRFLSATSSRFCVTPPFLAGGRRSFGLLIRSDRTGEDTENLLSVSTFRGRGDLYE